MFLVYVCLNLHKCFKGYPCKALSSELIHYKVVPKLAFEVLMDELLYSRQWKLSDFKFESNLVDQ